MLGGGGEKHRKKGVFFLQQTDNLIYELQIQKSSPHMSSTLFLPHNILISEKEYLVISKTHTHTHFPKLPSSPKE